MTRQRPGIPRCPGPDGLSLPTSFVAEVGRLTKNRRTAERNRNLADVQHVRVGTLPSSATGNHAIALEKMWVTTRALRPSAHLWVIRFVTMIPLLTTGIVARVFWRQNYLTICGVFAGSMTDPPMLAFANSQSDSEASSTAYAAVYPLTMILRIIAAQAIVMLFA